MSRLQDEAKNEMEEALEHLNAELKGIRTGRANPALLDSVSVEVYGSDMRLKDLGNVTAPEARQLLITPYDSNNVGAIAKGIDKANLSVQVIADGNVVRVNIPTMDEAMRKEMVKLASRKVEDGKVSIRNVRRKFNDLAKKKKGDGDITEDEQKSLEKKIQTLTDDYCQKADEAGKAKEKDIMVI